jgi:ABC-type polar amino acid transport system ATPase subunit
VGITLPILHKSHGSLIQQFILFESTYDPLHYNKAIHVSEMEHDLLSLSSDNLIKIDNRVNIGSVQKKRISIAKYVFSNIDVYVFDNSSSALDTYVGH